MRDFIALNLGPTLEEANLRRVKLMVFDHNRDVLPHWPSVVCIMNYSTF